MKVLFVTLLASALLLGFASALTCYSGLTSSTPTEIYLTTQTCPADTFNCMTVIYTSNGGVGKIPSCPALIVTYPGPDGFHLLNTTFKKRIPGADHDWDSLDVKSLSVIKWHQTLLHSTL
ncbi:uncharacterized protein LOC144827078 [Lissotriton helveticus]